MSTRTVIPIFIAALTQASCVSVYSNHPEIDTEALLYPEHPIEIKYALSNDLRSTILNEHKYELPQKYKEIAFINYPEEGIPGIGNFLAIKIYWGGLPHGYESTHQYISMWTLFVIPYFDTTDINISYTLYSDGNVIGQYVYVEHAKTIVWLPLLPVFWINLLYNNFDEHVEKTLYKFINDAYSEDKLRTNQ